MSHYLDYFERALQLAAALIEKAVKDWGWNSQIHLNLKHSDSRADQKDIENHTLKLNGCIMTSSKMKGFDGVLGGGEIQQTLTHSESFSFFSFFKRLA